MESQQGYLQRLADIDAAVARAQRDPDIVLEQAAGLLAGRVGCRVQEAHAHLLQVAAEQDRDPRDVAAETMTMLEGQARIESRELRAAVDQALHPPRQARERPRRREAAKGEPAPADWADVAQQILDGMPGNHALLTPLHNNAGEIDDYMIVAASPAAADVAGRRAKQLVGLRAREAYPYTVDGPVWRACRTVLADQVPRKVGPFPYAGPREHAPAELTFTVWVRPAGPGLLNTWERGEAQTRLSDRIAQTERLGNLGWGEWDLVTGNIVWSDELYRIYERDPLDGPMPSEESESLVLPEDEPVRRQAAESFGRGEPADITYRIRIGGRIKHIRTVVDAQRDAEGRPLKVYGIVQDITAREVSRAKLARVEAQLREHQQSLAAEHRLAAQLQQIILPIPAAPVDLPGLRIAVRYLPAEQASRVGGDWFHAAAADDGSVVLAIGDVAGHGIHAATTMALLRHALAALTVTTTTDPAGLLAHLNRLLYAGGDVPGTATAVVARYHPPSGTLAWAQAGHLAPLHTRGGVTTELVRPHGPLLGAIANAFYGTATAQISPGDMLMFYTDGLIEHRRHTLQEGLAPVTATLNRVSAEGSQQPLADVLAQLRRANPDDDTCILVARPLLSTDGDPRAGNGRSDG